MANVPCIPNSINIHAGIFGHGVRAPGALPEEARRYLATVTRDIDRRVSLVAGLLTNDAVPNQPGRSSFARLGSNSLGSAAFTAEIANFTLFNAVKDAPDGGSVTFIVWLQAAEL